MEGRAEALVAEGEAALRRGGGLFGGLFGGGTERYEDAAEKFKRAGLAFKASKRWDDGAKTFQRAAECYVKAKSDGEAAQAYAECARCFVKAGDAHSATAILEREALPRIVESGHMSQAAKLHNEIAELLEGEDLVAAAIENYEKAADMFTAENAMSSAHKCLAKVARLSVRLEPPNYDRTAAVFEQIGSECLGNNLLKFQAKNYFFDAMLAILAKGDVVAAELALGKFNDMDYTFPGSRESKLCGDLVQAYKDINVDAFVDAIYNYDQISKLEPWRTNLLLRVKTAMGGGAGGAGGGAAAGGGGSGDLTSMM